MMINRLISLLTLTFLVCAYSAVAGVDALDEVNQYRSQRGLRPFIRDTQLAQAAQACADYRAAHFIEGHTSPQIPMGDFAFLPPGAHADSIGCGAWLPSWGWGSCCSEDNYTYAGAAYTMGRDGKRYMQLYVSNTPNVQTVAAAAVVQPTASWQRVEEGWWYLNNGKHIGFLHDDRTFQWRRDDGSFSEGQRLEAGQIP